jgi:hypothetical protein
VYTFHLPEPLSDKSAVVVLDFAVLFDFYASRAFLCQLRAYPSAEPPAYKRSSQPFQAFLSHLRSSVRPIPVIPSPADNRSVLVYPASPA